MFEQPTKGDIDRALSTLMHEARHRLAARRNEVMAEATKAGALQSTRRIIVVAKAAEKIHVEVMQQVTSMLREFAQRMDIAPSQITEWARPHLENLGSTLLEVVPQCGFPNEQKRIAAQYQAQFDQRLTVTLRDVEIGFVKGSGFAGVPSQDEWVRASEAVAMLKPILAEYSARLRICERAHGGLLRARAEQFHDGQRVFHNRGIPKEFWWAEGHQALEQDWAAGDFSTWIERGSIQLKAFGVTFARADIGKLLPPPNSVKAEAVAHTEEDEQITDKLDALVPSAALSYKQAILDLRDDSRVSFRGPALELREALREILDHLAPDSEVTAAPGYVQEKDRTGPTMKQKVRFIMKKKEKRSSSDAPEQTVTAFEEAIAGLTRAVSERSSKATHVAGERLTVVQLRRFVVVVFHEILET
jgi:Predicted pPIWI-associating nuclease